MKWFFFLPEEIISGNFFVFLVTCGRQIYFHIVCIVHVFVVLTWALPCQVKSFLKYVSSAPNILRRKDTSSFFDHFYAISFARFPEDMEKVFQGKKVVGKILLPAVISFSGSRKLHSPHFLLIVEKGTELQKYCVRVAKYLSFFREQHPLY